MTNDELFKTNEDTTNEALNPEVNYFEELVGEGKKFKSPEDLARAKAESDRFIEQLKSENAGMRQELTTRQTLEQLMDKIATPKSPELNQSNNQNSNGEPDGNTNNSRTITEEDIARLVEKRMSEVERVRIHRNNLNQVAETLKENIGPDYVTHLKTKAVELGMSEEALNNMAKETPKAFLKLVEGDTPKRATTSQGGLFSPPQGHSLAQQTGSKKQFSPTGVPKMSYYEELKRKNPASYWSPDVQNKMHKDAITLGADFFDTP